MARKHDTDSILFHAQLIVRRTNYYRHACKQNLDGDENKPRITGASVKKFQLTLASAEENCPDLRDLLGPVEPEISIFFEKSTNQRGAERSFVWPQIRILAIMQRL